jgi:hypothetical protein
MPRFVDQLNHIDRARAWLRHGTPRTVTVPSALRGLCALPFLLVPMYMMVDAVGDDKNKLTRHNVVLLGFIMCTAIMFWHQVFIEVRVDDKFRRWNAELRDTACTPQDRLQFHWETWLNMYHLRVRMWYTLLRVQLFILGCASVLACGLAFWALYDGHIQESCACMFFGFVLNGVMTWCWVTYVYTSNFCQTMENERPQKQTTLRWITRAQRVRRHLAEVAPSLSHLTLPDALEVALRSVDVEALTSTWSTLSSPEEVWMDVLRYMQIMCMRTSVTEAAQYHVQRRRDWSGDVEDASSPGPMWVAHAIHSSTEPHPEDVLITVPRVQR